VCLYVYVARQRQRATIGKFLDASFSMLPVSYRRRDCGSVYLPIVAKLRIVGGVVFYAARVVSKESRRFFPELVLSVVCFISVDR
jgi:hypothetical protein